ncbi:MAG: hypothetical protein Q8Q47_05005, partial [Ignavibacteriaceae bacterium]|nr:hypothetical protein [Ignavibacteriaceae bacterium]
MKFHRNNHITYKIFFISLMFLSLKPILAQRVLSLEDALSIALKESYSIQSSFYALESSQK